MHWKLKEHEISCCGSGIVIIWVLQTLHLLLFGIQLCSKHKIVAMYDGGGNTIVEENENRMTAKTCLDCRVTGTICLAQGLLWVEVPYLSGPTCSRAQQPLPITAVFGVLTGLYNSSCCCTMMTFRRDVGFLYVAHLTTAWRSASLGRLPVVR